MSYQYTNENEARQPEAGRWGLPAEAIADLSDRLQRFWWYFGQWTRTRTRDTSGYGLGHVSGLLRMIGLRTMAEIAPEGNVAEQDLHQFMSYSPWSGRAVIEQA